MGASRQQQEAAGFAAVRPSLGAQQAAAVPLAV